MVVVFKVKYFFLYTVIDVLFFLAAFLAFLSVCCLVICGTCSF